MWTTILGVILGFVLSKVGDYWRDSIQQKTIERKARSLIKLELNENKAALSEYWYRVKDRQDSWYSDDGEFLWGQMAQEAAAVPLPKFSKDCWLANLSNLPETHTEGEMVKLWREYKLANNITTLWQDLVKLNNERSQTAHHVEMQQSTKGGGGAGMLGHIVSSFGFAQNGIPAAQEFCFAVERFLGDKESIFEHH
jgi:citrate lyase beta subunit